MANPFQSTEPVFSKEFPGHPDGEPFLAAHLRARLRGEFETQLRVAYQMLYLFGRDPSYLILVAQACEKLGKLDYAIAYYEEALSKLISLNSKKYQSSISEIRHTLDYLRWILERPETEPLRLYIDMDDVLCDYMGAYEKASAAAPDEPYPQSRAGFYLGLVPIEGAVEAMRWIESDSRLEAFILTAPSVYNPHSYTEKRLWTEKHLGFEWCNRLVLSPDKSLFQRGMLIDDRQKGHGQDRFKGKLARFGYGDFGDWKAVTKYIEYQLK